MGVGVAPATAQARNDATLKGVSYAGPTTHFIKLHVGDPGVNGTANPAANTTRHAVTWGTDSNGVSANTNVITWTTGEVTTSEDYSHFSDWSTVGPSGGTFIGSGIMTAAPVTAGFSFSIAIGGLTFTEIVAT